MLTLYFGPGSSSMAAHIALHEVALFGGDASASTPFFSAIPISFARQEQRSAAFLAINPEGKVPVLVSGDLVLTEVAAILFYVAGQYPQVGLWPTGDLVKQARAISWMSFIASTVHPARRLGREHAETIYGLVERRVGQGPWLLGQYTVADIHLFRLYWRARNSLGMSTDLYPALEAHYLRMMERPAVQRTLEIEAGIGYELPGHRLPTAG